MFQTIELSCLGAPRQNKPIKGFCGACRRENRVGRMRALAAVWNFQLLGRGERVTRRPRRGVEGESGLACRGAGRSKPLGWSMDCGPKRGSGVPGGAAGCGMASRAKGGDV